MGLGLWLSVCNHILGRVFSMRGAKHEGYIQGRLHV